MSFTEIAKRKNKSSSSLSLMSTHIERRKNMSSSSLSFLDGHEDEDDISLWSPTPVVSSGGWMTFLLSLSAGLGGFLFGYDTGVISGALLYIKDDFEEVNRSTFLQETIVSTAILGAAVGAACGGRFNDSLGRRTTILISDVVFLLGALLMACAFNPYLLIGGRLVVGFGIGIASMTVPLYIAELSPPDKRGALVTLNVLMITTGQFLSYIVNYAFTRVPGTWRWMLGVAGLPALLQAVLFMYLPESPRWLAGQKRFDEALSILRSVHSPEVSKVEILEVMGMMTGHHQEVLPKANLRDVFRSKEMRLALLAGIGMQVFQQFVGINTVMYYSTSIVTQAGFASHEIALLISSGVAGMNAIGSVVGILLIDRVGRRKLALTSLLGVVAALSFLAVSFQMANDHSPSVTWPHSATELSLACPAFVVTEDRATSNCFACLQSGCGFCGNKMLAGSCLVYNSTATDVCEQSSRSWYGDGCPSEFGWLAMLGLVLYIMAFSPGMGPVPWAVNSEIYPLEFRGFCGGIAATANWISNFIVAQTFLTLIESIGPALTFLICAAISVLAIMFVGIALPETKGLSFEEVRMVWERTVATDGLVGNWLRGGWFKYEEEADDKGKWKAIQEPGSLHQ